MKPENKPCASCCAWAPRPLPKPTAPSIDWTLRESARARIRVMVKRILRL